MTALPGNRSSRHRNPPGPGFACLGGFGCWGGWLLGWMLFTVVAGSTAWASEPEPSLLPPRGERPPRIIRIEGGGTVDENNVRTARETASHAAETPSWSRTPGFERDVFTFARLVFQNETPGPRSRSRGFGPWLGWWVDYPDADLNLSWRLQQMTSMRTDPDGRVLGILDDDLFDYPLLYLEHAGYMLLTDPEIVRLRGYLNNGGVLFVNDFWNRREWEGFAAQMAKVLPGRSWTNLGTDHPLFRCVYDLRRPMHQLRVPTMQFWDEDFDPRDPAANPHRVDRGEGSEDMSIRMLADDAGRIQVLAIHNSDVSDGWERETESDAYFSRFSEKTAYPLAINILVYLMLH